MIFGNHLRGIYTNPKYQSLKKKTISKSDVVTKAEDGNNITTSLLVAHTTDSVALGVIAGGSIAASIAGASTSGESNSSTYSVESDYTPSYSDSSSYEWDSDSSFDWD